MAKHAYKPGHKKMGGRQLGTPNKKTEQWELFTRYLLEGGLQKLEQELMALSGKDYVNAMVNLLEYHKPKLNRSEMTGPGGSDLIPPTTVVFQIKKIGKKED